MTCYRLEFRRSDLLHQMFNGGSHDLEQRRGPDTEKAYRRREYPQYQELATVYVLKRRHVFVRDRTEDDPLHQPQGVSSAENQRHTRQRCVPEVRTEAREDHKELTNEA